MTNALSREGFDRASDYVRRNARPLDVALLDLALESEDPHRRAAVTEALAPFQNSDGGFGHGIEPDFHTPASTAMATSMGFDVLRQANANSKHPLVVSGMKYLLETLDQERWVWPIINKNVDLAPHAPWWNFSAELAADWNQFRFNPTAELVSCCYEHNTLVPAAVLDSLTSTLIKSLNDAGTLTSYYDLRCCLHLRDTPSIPQRLQETLDEIVLSSAAKLAPDNPHANYFELVPRREAFLATAVATPLESQFARAIESQSADGSWGPWWDWSEVSKSAWQIAEHQWRGIITRQTIETFVAHHRIA